MRPRHEHRTRVMFHLPLQNTQEAKAIEQIVHWLKSDYSRRSGVGGFTHSLERPPVFRGLWYCDSDQRWMPDKIVLFMVDLLFDPKDQTFQEYIEALKDEIKSAYRNYGSAQQEIWVISHRIYRYI